MCHQRRCIEHIAAELLICQSPASNSNYIFSAVFTYFLGGFLRKKRWCLGLRPRPRCGSLQRSPTPPSWAGGCSPGRPCLLLRPTPRHTLAGAPPPNSWIRHCRSRGDLRKAGIQTVYIRCESPGVDRGIVYPLLITINLNSQRIHGWVSFLNRSRKACLIT